MILLLIIISISILLIIVGLLGLLPDDEGIKDDAGAIDILQGCVGMAMLSLGVCLISIGLNIEHQSRILLYSILAIPAIATIITVIVLCVCVNRSANSSVHYKHVSRFFKYNAGYSICVGAAILLLLPTQSYLFD